MELLQERKTKRKTDSSGQTKIEELILDIQTGGDKQWWKLYREFPETMKGECAKPLWSDTNFSYGAEYGALVILLYLSSSTPKKEENKE